MRELTEHEVQLNSARINFQGCLRTIEEMLDHKQFAPEERDAELKDMISQANWAIDYLFRAREELRTKP